MQMSEKPSQKNETFERIQGLWRTMSGYHAIYFGAILSVGLGALARTGIYALLAYFVDDVVGKATMWQIIPWLSLGFIALAVLQGAFTFWGGRLAALASEGIVRRLRNRLYDHLQRLTFSYHDQNSSGELLQRTTSDIDAIQRLFAEQGINIGRITLLFLINFVALALIDWQVAVGSSVIVPVILLLSFVFFKKVGVGHELFQDQEGVMTNRLQENLTGMRVVKAFARQEHEMDRFEKENEALLGRGKKLVMLHAFFWPSTDILSGIQMVVGYYIGGRMVLNGTMQLGEYIAAMGYIIAIIWPIRELGRFVADSSTAIVSFGRISKIFDVAREPLDEGTYRPTTPPKGHIRFENVCLQYSGEDSPTVLQNISFEVLPGQTVALLGSTGSGKTSLVNLLPRFYDYTSGSITLDGVELKEYPRAWLREQIGVVMQEPFLFATTLRNNISYGVGRDVSDDEVIAAAKAAAVHQVIETFKDGYDTLVGERGMTLSGGQKQRITVARTLLQNPSILILDDATSSVDMETESQIRSALQHLQKNRTTFIIAHRIQTVMSADLILVLEKARIIQYGTHDSLLQQEDGVYRRIYEVQASIEEDLQQELAVEAAA